MKKECLRVIDANLNRLREGLRVCEDITRFIYNDPRATREFKRLRFDITDSLKALAQPKGPARLKSRSGGPFSIKKLLDCRDAHSDILRVDPMDSYARCNISDLFFANIQRAKEAARVLEEFARLINKAYSGNFKNIRFRIYKIEKETFKRLPSLRNNR